MFIDYVCLMLINVTAGFVLLALYVYWGLDSSDSKRWIPGFSMVGVISLINGLYMSWTWPLPGSYNIPHGQMSVLFGILFLGAAFAIAKDWNLLPVTIYALISGIAAVLIGVRIINLGLTKEPIISGMGFILSGLAGVFAPVLYHYLQKNRTIRILGTIELMSTAGIWAFITYMSYWEQLSMFSKWIPTTMK